MKIVCFYTYFRRDNYKMWLSVSISYGTNIYIPTLIDDYNYCIGGVDMADQRIVYYLPSNLVCQKNWISIFNSLLDNISNNIFIVHLKSKGKKA